MTDTNTYELLAVGHEGEVIALISTDLTPEQADELTSRIATAFSTQDHDGHFVCGNAVFCARGLRGVILEKVDSNSKSEG